MRCNARTVPGMVLFLALLGLIAGMSSVQAQQKKDTKAPCVTSAKGPLVEGMAVTGSGMRAPLARVGKTAPDFEAVAFQGDGFKKVKLSDYSGKWVVLCFYPGDFTFV